MSTTLSARQDRRWVLVGFLAVSAFVSSLNFLLLGPLLISIAREFTVAEATVGQLAMMQALLAAAIAVVASPLLDRYQRGTLLRLELGVLILATCVSALAPSFTWLLVGRALAGVGGAFIFAACLAAAADLFDDTAARNRAVSVVWVAVTLASFVGIPAVTLLADRYGWRLAVASLLVPLLAGLAGSFWLPHRHITPEPGGIAQWLAGYRRVLRNPPVVWLVAIVVIVHLVWGGSFVYFAAYATHRFAIDAATLSLLFLLGGAVEIVASIITPILLRWLPASTLCLGFSLLGILNFLLVDRLFDDLWLLAPFVAIVSLVVTGLGIATNVLLLEAMPDHAGSVMALQSAAIEVGWGLGATVAGVALARGGYGAIYSTLGLLLPLAVIAIFAFRRNPPYAAPA